MPNAPKTGCLTLVATPIGNLGDIPLRAIEILKEADCIACEDTRVTGKLLSKLGLKTKPELLSYRNENEQSLAEPLAARIADGQAIVLVADAGTPAISDPGFRLVRACRKNGLKVTAVPGPCAAVTALALSGLPSDGFLFVGFLPPKRAARVRFFDAQQDFEYTIILYESCHRISKCLDDLVETLGADRAISVSRELTKLHETIHSGPAGKVREQVAQASQKGEFVISIAKKNYSL
ncbi:MAG: Ribosomal RNA small subunit methyltransferase I [Opitutia bacterium UBA7350]|nr:MAG: Ribosomal RNA small subunit methyltransferase I [Opitutae bacterium UBA7350]